MSAGLAKPARMNVDQFLSWLEGQGGSDRWELVEGEVFGMAGDRAIHNRVKYAVARALDDAIRASGLSCTMFTDGVGVRIDDWTLRIPDASVQCGSDVDDNALTIDPIIVVEVTSPSSAREDEDQKLIEYMGVAGIEHYIVVHPRKALIVHHSRHESGDIRTRIQRQGDRIDLIPPGLSVMVADLLGPAGQPRGGAA